jgi:transglutaminase-like putative cysteine protease
VALAGVTGAALFGFSRIFESFEFLWPLLVVAGALHVGAAVLRRRGVGIAISFVTLSGVWALLVTWLFFRETTFALLPTGTTLEVAGAELDRSWSAFRELVAPAPALTGFVVAAALAVGIAVFLADWAAFRMWSTRDAIVPSLTLFVFATLLAGERQRISSALLYLGAGLAFVLLHRVARLERSSGWVSSERRAGGRALLRVGVVIGLVAVVLGAVVGPRLPGVDEPAIVDWRGGESASGRVTVSPLVDIRSRLVERSDTEVFQVQSEQPAYWRMTALDDFDGNIWRSSGSYTQVAGPLPTTSRFAPRSTDVITQSFRIQALSTLWLPAAFEPLAVDSAVPVRYQPETATLIVDPEAASADGAEYAVQSAVSDYSAAQLSTAGGFTPPEMAAMLELPADFSDSARRTAEEIVAGASNRYEQAMALQDFFRDSGGFVYDLDVESGHDGDAIDEFLEKRRGYCEQFAGAFAAMARSVGIPARVAVGFTWGDEIADQPGTYQVRGRNAHAWPEVYLWEYGWVGFEPTPGRGAPNAEGYTGQPASQEGPLEESPEAPTTTVESAPTTTAPAAEATPSEQASELLRSDAAAGSAPGGGGGWAVPFGGVSMLLVALVIGYLLVVPGYRVAHRRRRRAAAAGAPSAEVAVAWAEVGEDLRLLRVHDAPDETHHELAGRAAGVMPEQAGELRALADAADAAAYGPETVDEQLAAKAREDADAVIAGVNRRVPWPRRVLAALDPRPRRRRSTPARHSVDRPHD